MGKVFSKDNLSQFAFVNFNMLAQIFINIIRFLKVFNNLCEHKIIQIFQIITKQFNSNVNITPLVLDFTITKINGLCLISIHQIETFLILNTLNASLHNVIPFNIRESK